MSGPETVGPVAHNDLLGRATRTGSWAEQAVSTHRLVEEAVAVGRDADAAELAGYSLVEMAEPVLLFPTFFESSRRFLIREGVPEPELAAASIRFEQRAIAAGAAPIDLVESWRSYEGAVARFVTACANGHAADAIAGYLHGLHQWRLAHDWACNRVYLYAELCAQYLGEDRVGDFWDELMRDIYPSRDRFGTDRAAWSESVEILSIDTAETFRGHLSGPGRLGDIEISDEPDRIVFSFSPCGTGGRTFLEHRDDESVGGGDVTMGDPERFGVTTSPHDWSWSKTGVCLYCVHCCQLQERIPIRRLGYPLRVIDPPVWPEALAEGRCTWTIYKDLSQIPAEAYERVGETKPAILGAQPSIGSPARPDDRSSP